MHWSPLPHFCYLMDCGPGQGPGAIFFGDTARWNYRYFWGGVEVDQDLDKVVSSMGDDDTLLHMAGTGYPLDMLRWTMHELPAEVTPQMRQRALEAETRCRGGVPHNVVHVNFRSKA